MKMIDPPVDAVRRIRHRISKAFGHDLKSLTDHYIKLQEQLRKSGRYRIVGMDENVPENSRHRKAV